MHTPIVLLYYSIVYYMILCSVPRIAGSRAMSKKVVVASGYFNPLHWGHVSFLQKAREQEIPPRY